MVSLHHLHATGSVQEAAAYLDEQLTRYHSQYYVYDDEFGAGTIFYDVYGSGTGAATVAQDDAAPYRGPTCLQVDVALDAGEWIWRGLARGATHKLDLSGATTLSFYARSPDNARVNFSNEFSGDVTLDLTPTWTRFEFNVASSSLSATDVLFGFAADTSMGNPSSFTFYVDEIAYDLARPTEPRFLKSYDTDTPGDSEDEIRFSRVFRNAAWLYDNAIVLSQYLARGEIESARLIADAILTAFQLDGRIQNAYRAGTLIDEGVVQKPFWFDDTTGAALIDSEQYGIRLGNHVHATLAVLNFYLHTGEASYLDGAKSLASWMLTDGGFEDGNPGFSPGYDYDTDTATLTLLPPAKSTEENADAFGLFSRLASIDPSNPDWADAAQHALSFLRAMYVEGTPGHFHVGTLSDGVTPNELLALDAQTFPLLALTGEETPYVSALQTVATQLSYGSNLFRYDEASSGGAWMEGTAQYALTAVASGLADPSPYLSAIESHQLPNGAIPATDRDHSTGIGISWYDRAHISATAWYILASLNHNPFHPVTVVLDAIAQPAAAGADIVVAAEIHTPDVDDAEVTRTLYYAKGGGTVFTGTPFSLVSGYAYQATIPADAVTMRGVLFYPEVAIDGGSTYAAAAASLSSPGFITVSGNTTIYLTTMAGPPTLWNVIGASVSTGNSLPDIVGSTFGTYGVGWLAWRWNTALSRWERAAGASPVSSELFDPGKGWWALVLGSQGGSTSLTVPGVSVDSRNEFSMPLQVGWNLLSNPFDFPLRWSDSTASITYLGQTVTPTQAQANQWVLGRIVYWDTMEQRYVNVHSNAGTSYIIPPNQGFWTYSAVPAATFNLKPFEAPPSTPAGPAAAPWALSNGQEWKVVLTASSPQGRDSVEAIVGKAQPQEWLSSLKPPAMPMGDAPRVMLRTEEFGDQALWHHVQTAGEEMVWQVEVTTGATLSWNLVQVPRGYALQLEDLSGGRVIDLQRSKTEIEWEGGDSHKFLLRATRQTLPTVSRLLANFPNPFNPETWIPYDLSQAESVTIRIYDALGEPVRTFHLGEREAGAYRSRERAAHWDGRNDLGEPVASGLYLYEIKAGTFRASRRMIVLK